MSNNLKKVRLIILFTCCFPDFLCGLSLFLNSKQSVHPRNTQSTTITICALCGHSFQVALNIPKESGFQEKNTIKVEAILLGYTPRIKAHEFNFTEKTSILDLVSIAKPSLGYHVTNKWIQSLDEFIKSPGILQSAKYSIQHARSINAQCFHS